MIGSAGIANAAKVVVRSTALQCDRRSSSRCPRLTVITFYVARLGGLEAQRARNHSRERRKGFYSLARGGAETPRIKCVDALLKSLSSGRAKRGPVGRA